jgi:hypothetical protein
MKYKKLKLSILLFLGIGLTGLQAQEGVHTSGGEASGSGGSTSYSVGQVAYQIHTNTNGSVAEGVQQPYEISVVTALDEAKGINRFITAYPNPTNGFLTLEIQKSEGSNLSYRLHDMNGRLLQNRMITDSRTRIGMGHLVPATYFVTVVRNDQELKTFKIIKK